MNLNKLFTIKPYEWFFGLGMSGQGATHYPNPRQNPSDWNYRYGTRWGDVGEYTNFTLICLIFLELLVLFGVGYLVASNAPAAVRIIGLLFILARIVIVVKLIKLIKMKKVIGHSGRFYYPGENGEAIRGD